MLHRPQTPTLFPYTTLFRSRRRRAGGLCAGAGALDLRVSARSRTTSAVPAGVVVRSEEHTSELQSQFHLVCRLLLEKNKTVPRVNAAPANRAWTGAESVQAV